MAALVLPGFANRKNNLDSYLLPFGRYATAVGWKRSDWANQLIPLLSGRALDVYSGLSDQQQWTMIGSKRLFWNKATAADSEELNQMDWDLVILLQ